MSKKQDKIDTISINGDEYILASEVIETVVEHVTIDGGKSIAQRWHGKKVIVRSRNEGINAGIVVCADETGIEIKDCRRLYYHEPKDKAISWYEGVAQSGLGGSSKVSGTVDSKIIIEDYSLTLCTDEAFDSIMEWTPNAQS